MVDTGEVEVMFEDGYDLLVVHVLTDDADEERTLIGQKEPRLCRFCGRGKPDVSFKDEAHVVPAALGNRTLLSYEECVACNQEASALEDALCKYLAPARALARRKSRGGNKLKALPQQSSVQSDPERNLVMVTVNDDKPKIQIADIGGGRALFHLVRPKYSPMDMARSLMRMGLFFIDKNEPVAAAMLRWIRREGGYQPTMLEGTFPGPGSPATALMVFRRKQSFADLPAYVVLLAYANTVILMFATSTPACSPQRNVLVPEPGRSRYVPQDLKWGKLVTVLEEGKLEQGPMLVEFGYESKKIVVGTAGDRVP